MENFPELLLPFRQMAETSYNALTHNLSLEPSSPPPYIYIRQSLGFSSNLTRNKQSKSLSCFLQNLEAFRQNIEMK